MQNNIDELIANMLKGDEISLGRLISLADDESYVSEITGSICSYLGKAYCVGITGPPGSGKSTLVDKLTTVIRRRGLTVGIIAADPSSPVTGGAVLGDRIRMEQHYLDDGVFIRSVATRGSHGGLSKSVRAVVGLMDAFGMDIIMVETAGVGQTEVGIIEVADTVVLVMVPGYGDTMQFMKAGILEIANVIVVNKADCGDAETLVAELRDALALSSRKSVPPMVITEALNNLGVEELYQELEKNIGVASAIEC